MNYHYCLTTPSNEICYEVEFSFPGKIGYLFHYESMYKSNPKSRKITRFCPGQKTYYIRKETNKLLVIIGIIG